MTFIAHPHPRPTPSDLCVAGRTLAFGERFYVMGILNTTPDSFSDGGQFLDPQAAIERGLRMVEAGADIIDIGGESTRPGAEAVDADTEIKRVVPVIEALNRHLNPAGQPAQTLLSIDTSKALVAEAALEAGASIVNDISGLGFDPRMPAVVARAGAALVLMHIRGTPRTMQTDTEYEDLIGEVHAYFVERIARACAAGVRRDKIILDVGIGFGKSVAQNYQLIRELHRFTDLECPLLLGSSRKSFLGAVLNKPAEERVFGTAASVACGLYAGADIVRVHDVAEICDVVRITEAIIGTRDSQG
ncbi:dihydropteroate synthase [Bradymonas sediminis]|uniref:Dihydropteroate synthase n=1 Tax=Bradymonas sediminis TaxID=1548548 RepID=A0A2Z4FKI8_9DELT|nr:dihydropteroate synthase [Bradymonas sediminis]AWV89491.1 dihydropteroate synthase [Bradymonas sediminis]TDP76781.1 dihydropteroate synthase [Bradymonas sediminis]